MSGFLQVSLKKSQPVDFIKPLSGFIKNTFSQEILDDHKSALAELNQLRANAVVKVLDKHESSLDVLYRYYDQLSSMESKLPISEDQNRVNFTWQDAFDKGSLFGSVKCSLSIGAYEKCCVLFNIAALQSQLASSQNLKTDDGLKTAAKYFQLASGIFAHLKDSVYPLLQTLPTPDLSVDSLNALSAIMLAHAQDCFYTKAASDKMKDAIVAKLASQAADFYTDALRGAQSQMVKSMFDKEWLQILSCKQSFFTAAAEYHQSNVTFAAGQFGETVARLQKADRCMNDAKKAGDRLVDTREMADKVSKALATAKKDNEFIYHDKIPSLDSISSVGKAPLAKVLPLTNPMSSNFQDLFTKLVPVAIHCAMSVYDSRKAEVINKEVAKLREATQVINGILASLNLPAAIEDLSGSKVPQSVLDKSSDLKERGGLQSIDQLMQNLPDLLQRNREILDEGVRMLDEEAKEDSQMKERFKERWSRTPSAKLTEQLRQEAAKYRGILDNAVKADHIVKEKYNSSRRGLDILSMSEAEIANQLPKAGAVVSGGGQGAVQTLQSLMKEVEASRKERDALEEEFKSATTDMAPKFMAALVADGLANADGITTNGLEECYGALETKVEESLEKQQQLVSKIQQANDQFVSEKKNSGASDQREALLKEIAQSYDNYVELTANLKEGTKFYNDLTEILLKYQSKVSDLVFARRTEKEDMSKDIQNELAKGNSGPTPNIPSHHQAQQQQRQQPPARPPPPSTGAPSQPPQQSQPPPSSSSQSSYQAPPNAPYPSQPYYMPQPGYYAPPGGMPAYNPNMPPQGYQYPGYQPPPMGYMPPYGQQPPQQQQQQQPPVGYQGYPYQQQPPRQ